METNVRVRFAPSPTGPLHIGGVRTALFNYLFAKKYGGTFVLRIEDTDQNRYVPGAEQYIIEALDWCGIPFEEGPGREGRFGPYRQSERKELYRDYAMQLINSGNAYYAFDTAEALDALRLETEQKGETFIYNWKNRDGLDNSLHMDAETLQQRLLSGEPYVIRFKSPHEEILNMNDIIRGAISINTAILDDKVLFKSDGMPTYHLANIVDDHLMEITHVIRGEEWLPSMALHVLLYRAFGWKAPEFAHLPLILKPTGKGKLSKRDGDKLGFPVFPMQWKDGESGEVSKGYREEGYFPEAVINFLALLGWNPGTEQEVFNLEALINSFELSRVNKSGARFDPDKIKWFNQHYLQQQQASALVPAFREELLRVYPALSPELIAESRLERIAGLLKERAIFTRDLVALGAYFFVAPETYDEKAAKKQWKESTSGIVANVAKVLEQQEEFVSAGLESAVKEWISEHQLGFGQVMPALRLALVGEMSGPHVFDIMEILGKDETVGRLQKAIATLG